MPFIRLDVGSGSKNNSPHQAASRIGSRTWKGKLSRKLPQDSSQSSRHNTADSCFFFKLPGELRNYIYSFIIYPHQRHLILTGISSPSDLFSMLLRSSVFRLNKQIRAETLSYLCKNMIFTLVNFRTTVVFLEWIGPSGRSGLFEITLMLTCWDSSENGLREGQQAVELLKEVKSLRRLRLQFAPDFQLAALTSGQWETLDMMKNVSGGSGTFEWGLYGVRSFVWETMPEQVEVYLGRENMIDS